MKAYVVKTNERRGPHFIIRFFRAWGDKFWKTKTAPLSTKVAERINFVIVIVENTHIYMNCYKMYYPFIVWRF